jgi:hypothetical protein
MTQETRMTWVLKVLMALALLQAPAAAHADEAKGKVIHNGVEMRVQVAVAVLDGDTGFLHVHLLERQPTPEELARLQRGSTFPGKHAELWLYVAGAQDRGWDAPPADEVPFQVIVADIAGTNTTATAVPSPATLKGTLTGKIQPGQVITLTARDEASSDRNKRANPKSPVDVVAWHVAVKATVLPVRQ